MTNTKTSSGMTDQQAAGAHVADQHQQAHQQGQDAMPDQQQDEKRRKAATEAEAQSIDGKAGQSKKSSHNHMGHVKAGTHEGAGGGAKSQRHH